MKIKSSLKSIKKRDLNSKLVRRRGRVYIINKNSIRFDPTNPAPPVTIMRFFILDMPGNVLLSRVLRQSTIGAERLDFRVRNGIGYHTFAIITRHDTNNVKRQFVKIKLCQKLL